MQANRDQPTLTDRVADALFRMIIARALRMPWEKRVPFMGRMMSHWIAPLLGYPDRIERNLSFIYPDMKPDTRREIVRSVGDNMGRTLAEIYSGEEFSERCRMVPIDGPGLSALEEAQAEGKGAVLISGHFGNYDVVRTALIEQGYDIAALYRPMNNPLFNRHYVKAITRVGPTFVRDKSGLMQLFRHLRAGRVVAMLVDQHYAGQEVLKFLGKPARTSLTPAEMALRYKVPLISLYATRQPDGLNFSIFMEEPIPHTSAPEMMQAFNDRLGRIITKHPGQWLWNHRRWRVKGDLPDQRGGK